ncbi:MAG: hypothetical protein R2781_08655 [Flavobacteriaceae bacterium]
MKYLLFSLTLLFYYSVNAQFDTSKLNGAAGIEPTKFGIVTASSPSHFSKINSYGKVFGDENGEPSPDTVGSPYFHDSYTLGSIIKDNEIFAENIALRYNIYNDIFIGKINLISIEDEAKTIIKSEEFKIKMGNNLFIALPSYGNPNALQYYQVLMTGNKGTLYKKNEKIYKERVMATTTLTRDIPPAFKDKASYYFADFEGHFNELPSSKKKIIELFGNNQKEMAEYIKKNKLNINNENDLIRLFRFYETLQ